MSVKVMAWVWDQDMPVKEKFVLLAYADHADHEGGSIFPANETIANKTGYSVRSIQRITRRLEETGYMIADGENVGGRNRSNRWKIPIYGGLKGDLNVMVSDKRVTKRVERVTKQALKGDIAVSSEPSIEPSLKEPSINAAAKREFLKSKGVGNPALDVLSKDPDIDLGYLESHFRYGDDRGDAAGLILHRIRSGDAAPKERERDYEADVREGYWSD